MDDEQIIELFFARSEQALGSLDEKYGQLCRSLSFNIVNDSRDAEECVNDAYLSVWNAIPPNRPNPLLAFLCRIVRNISISRYRSNTAEKRKSNYAVSMTEIEYSLRDPQIPEDKLNAKILSRAIENYLDAQTQENRVIFLRRYWFADSLRDIALRTGLTEKNVSVRLTRLRRKLKQHLQKEGLMA